MAYSLGETEKATWADIALEYKILYNFTVTGLKPVVFLGKALDDLRSFPVSVRRDAGYQIDRLQRGLNPDDWKPMKTVGLGAREIRVRDADGVFRVIYVTKFADIIYVLHCFQKKTEKTTRADIALAGKRYRALVEELET